MIQTGEMSYVGLGKGTCRRGCWGKGVRLPESAAGERSSCSSGCRVGVQSVGCVLCA